MLRALIVDDERLARVALRGLLEERGDVEIVGEADGVAAARLRLAELKPDVVFLDVQMPGGSGFELFGEGLHTKVVFCTAYEQYAVRAFEVNALDYLVKPVSPEQVDRALKRLQLPAEPNREDAPLGLDDLVALREAHALRFAPAREIAFIVAADDYSEVHLATGKPALVDVTLRRWEARLPRADFVRVHRSTLVNLHHVERVEYADERWQVVLKHGAAPLPVSRRIGRELLDRLEHVTQGRPG
jgi:two-component system LytT family response regulator